MQSYPSVRPLIKSLFFLPLLIFFCLSPLIVNAERKDGWEVSQSDRVDTVQTANLAGPVVMPEGANPCGDQDGGQCGGWCPPRKGCAVKDGKCGCQDLKNACKDAEQETPGLQCGGLCQTGAACSLVQIDNVSACACKVGGNNCKAKVGSDGSLVCEGPCSSGGCQVNDAGDGCECKVNCAGYTSPEGSLQCGGACAAGAICMIKDGAGACTCEPIVPPTPTPATTPTVTPPVVATPPACSGQAKCSGDATIVTTFGHGNSCAGDDPLNPPTMSVCDDAMRDCFANFSGCPAGCVPDPSQATCDPCTKKNGSFTDDCLINCKTKCIPSVSGGGGSGGGGTGGPVVSASCEGKKQVGPATGAVSSDDNQCSSEECNAALRYCKDRLNDSCQGFGGVNQSSVTQVGSCSYQEPASSWLDGKCKVECKGCCNR